MKIKHIIKLGEVDSTNNYARGRLLHKQSVEGTVVLAHHQNTGRGTGNNSWESEKNKNLTFSILLAPFFLNPSEQFILSKVVSLGVYNVVSLLADGCSIKWPNDIYIGNRKVAGILIENTLQSNMIIETIVGIGINVNQEVFRSNAPNPVSLKNITGIHFKRTKLLEEIYGSIIKQYNLLKSGDAETIHQNYLSVLFRFNEWSEFRQQNKSFEGKITGIDPHGMLIIQNRDKQFLKFQFKEVEYVI